MSVRALRRMTVAPTPCVQTLKGRMSVDVNGVMLEMEKTAQVKSLVYLTLTSISTAHFKNSESTLLA